LEYRIKQRPASEKIVALSTVELQTISV
jgi:hypothetical protein